MNLSQQQLKIKSLIEQVTLSIGDNPILSVAVALVESSLGLQLKSPTGAKGVFQLTSIAMKDLHQEMDKKGNEVIGVLCGLAFIHLLIKRHKTVEEVIHHYCDPKDYDFYIQQIKAYMKELSDDPLQ
jgi:membrane-bound lytic murein transglycosylase MltF